MTRGVISTPHPLAAEAGAQLLKDGGNAFDAAVAADAVLTVVYPHMTSSGGDLFALCWPAGAARPVTLVGAGRSGSLATIDAVRERGYESMPLIGPLTVTVPGTVDAWGRLVERFGTVGLEAVLEPAAAIAESGYPVSANLAQALLENFDWLHHEEPARTLYPPLREGMLMRNPDLALTLRAVGRSGFNTFYRGEVAAAIAEALERRDGLLTATDLALHRSLWADPVVAPYRELLVYNTPPPSQGLAALGMFVRLARHPAPALTPGSGFARALKQARDAVYPLRDRYISDPDFAPVPVEPFLDPAQAGAGLGDPLPEGDTIYLCCADEHGNVVSLIQSVANAFGSGIVAEGTGVLLQNRGCYFKLDPQHINRLEPQKRTMHTLIAAIAARDGRPWAAFGSMGADRQPQIQAQLLVNLVDRSLAPADAVAAPRLAALPGGMSWRIEADYPDAGAVARELGAELMPARHTWFGHAGALVVDGPGRWRAGADPRAEGSVVFVGS
jgi:gamma-glutamyltranspeptidase/glutathione hydrolase